MHIEKYFKLQLFWTFIGIVLLAISFFLGRITAPKPTNPQDTRTPAPVAVAKQTLNKKFQFPVNDNQGNEITKIMYTIQSADLQNEVIIKGQKATAVKGKTFLILNLKLTNLSDKTVPINTRDYVRLSANGSSDMVAADIHNDPIQIQPIATIYTRLGFAINETDKKLMLHVGEIDGKKTIIALKLKGGPTL